MDARTTQGERPERRTALGEVIERIRDRQSFPVRVRATACDCQAADAGLVSNLCPEHG